MAKSYIRKWHRKRLKVPFLIYDFLEPAESLWRLCYRSHGIRVANPRDYNYKSTGLHSQFHGITTTKPRGCSRYVTAAHAWSLRYTSIESSYAYSSSAPRDSFSFVHWHQNLYFCSR